MKRMTVTLGMVAAAGLAAAAIPDAPVAQFAAPETSPPAAYPAEALDLAVYDMIRDTGADQGVAEPYCDDHGVLTQSLATDFTETLTDTAVMSSGRAIEMWSSDMMGTWTRVLIRTDGVACVVGSGTFAGNVGTPMHDLPQEMAMAGM